MPADVMAPEPDASASGHDNAVPERDVAETATPGHGTTPVSLSGQGTAETALNWSAGRRILFVDFSEGGNSAEYKLAGWSTAAPDGSRTSGASSTLSFARPEVASDYSLVLKAKPFSVGAVVPHHRVSVIVSGQMVASIVVRGPIDIEIWLPWSLIGESPRFEVEFEFPDAERPSALLGSADRRLLALVVRSIALRRLTRQAVRQPVSRDHPERYKSLMMNLVSLGTNCEVGLMQRMCGAEPLGLFRFAATPIDGLVRALASDFEGLGEPGQTVIYHSASGEYLVHDRRYDVRWHTGVRVEHVAEDLVAVQQQQRLRYLARKMRDELRRGEALFVFRADEDLPRADVLEVVEEVRRFGDNTVLWVVPEAIAGSRGRVTWLEDGLMRATIDRLARTDIERDISFEGWIAICEKAVRLWRRGRAPLPMAASEPDASLAEA